MGEKEDIINGEVEKKIYNASLVLIILVLEIFINEEDNIGFTEDLMKQLHISHFVFDI